MAPCSTWQGSLKFSSVTCRVSMTPATAENESVYFYPFDRVAKHAMGRSATLSAETIEIEAFVAKDAIDWTCYDKAHFMVPDDAAGEYAFSVIRDALEETGTVAIAHLLLQGRERAIMLEPRDMGIVLWTLYLRDDAVARQSHAGAVELPEADPATMSRVAAEIDKRWKPWHPLQRDLPNAIDVGKRAIHAGKAAWRGDVIDVTGARRRQASL